MVTVTMRHVPLECVTDAHELVKTYVGMGYNVAVRKEKRNSVAVMTENHEIHIWGEDDVKVEFRTRRNERE